MNALFKFISNYCKKNVSRFHVPGHQGRCSFLNRKLGAKFDITEIKGADWLFASKGPIADLENRLSSLFGQNVAISTSGSTLCVQTMVALCRNKVIVANRCNAHVAFFNVCSILGVRVEWFGFDEQAFGVCNFNLLELKQKLQKFSKNSCAVYVTSPDYYGFLLPIKEISNLCETFGALLLVDCAHGAHLNFTANSSHPAQEGASLSCSSLHKTLPALTGAAVLTFDSNLFSKQAIKAVMSKFSTTSPSYLTLTSIDFCIGWLIDEAKTSFAMLEHKKEELIKKLKLRFLKNTDVAKLVLDCTSCKLSGNLVAEFLRMFLIEPGFVNEKYVVLLLTPFLNRRDWNRLSRCFYKLQNKNFVYKVCGSNICLRNENKKVTFQAKTSFFKKTEIVKTYYALGKKSAVTYFKQPPGTVLVYEGEEINSELLEQIERFGLSEIEVVI